MTSSTQRMTALERAVLKAYHAKTARGPVGPSSTYTGDVNAQIAATHAQFVRAAAELADDARGWLQRSGHCEHPMYQLTAAGREAISDG